MLSYIQVLEKRQT